MLLKYASYLIPKSCRYSILRRGIQHKTDVTANNQFTEIELHVTWGTIRGKLWGSKNKQPIVALHGWLDNAASFDLLAPLLKNSSILAIDLPGHGLSSWLPKGIPYFENLNTLTLRSIVDHYGWSKIKLLGHSMGGVIAFSYARLFPTETEFVISLDSLGYTEINVTKYNEKQKREIIELIEFNKKTKKAKPSYSKNVAIQKWMDANKFSDLDISTTEILLNRGAAMKTDGTYYYTHDFRLRFSAFVPLYTNEAIVETAKLISCPYLVLRTDRSPFNKDRYWDNFSEALSISSKDFRMKILEGCHHMHLTKAQMVADEINPFLQEYDK